MSEDSGGHEAPTRRDYMKYGGAVVGGGLLAGCAGDSDSGDEGEAKNTPSSTEMPTATPTEADATDTSYSVTMSPMGTVNFESPPENVFTILAHHADMVLAMGRGEDLNAIFNPELFDGLYNRVLEHVDGVSVDWADLQGSWNPAKESLYELESDIHLADPANVATMGNLDTADIEEVRENLAPWFGNSLSGPRDEPPEQWSNDYQYYGLWEIFEKVAQVFQEEDRYQALATMHANVLSTIESNLPPADERPRVARILISPSGVDEGIWAYSMNDEGFYQAHTRPMQAEDAFGDMDIDGQIDLETLAEAAPDVILRTGGMSPGANWTEIKSELQEDPVAGEIPAVKNGRVHPLAVRFGGPIMNLFQLEMSAKALYPERFGAWPIYDGGAYPEFSDADQLFDRQRAADIINGDI
ncbi:ABC transporter substrate-binding protein [Haloarcula salina]|uniref:ABC transporter substrate-binding protein n=1 Tax=Haloarcula salina TaxID=1429914 RepID=UPI003C6F83F9